MTSGRRVLKRIIVVLAVIIIFGGGGLGINRLVNPPTPTPTPDPRQYLDPIEVISQDLLEVREGDYDFVAKVRNPNAEYGSSLVNYTIIFYDNQNIERESKRGSFYILPGQTKYIAEKEIALGMEAADAKLKIISVDWQKLDLLGLDGVDLPVANPEYARPDDPHIFGKVAGRIYNNSDFDVDRVDVTVVLAGEDGTPIAVSLTDIRTFLAQTVRGFEVFWFQPFEGVPATVHAEADTNVFENDNFIRTHGGHEQFQQLF